MMITSQEYNRIKQGTQVTLTLYVFRLAVTGNLVGGKYSKKIFLYKYFHFISWNRFQHDLVPNVHGCRSSFLEQTSN